MASPSSAYLPNVFVERSPLFPNPLTCISDMATTGIREFAARSPWGNWEQWLKETWEWIEVAVKFDSMMVVWAVLICVVLTVIRDVLSKRVFTPFAKQYKLSEDSTDKYPESMWKLGVYSVTWVWSAYITFKDDIMFDLGSHWQSWHPEQTVDAGTYWLFTFEIGFYLHYMYGMMFLEAKRKDFVVLMLHHILTIALIVGCYIVKFHIIGVYLIFIHDIGDVFLEGSKCFNYFKVQNGKINKTVELCANVGFIMFAIEYFLFRIYWFLTKALYSTLHVCMLVFPKGPFYLPFNIMLLALLAMQIFWFSLIIKLLVKVLILREDLSDIRDIEEEEEGEGGKGLKGHGGKENGTIETKKEQ